MKVYARSFVPRLSNLSLAVLQGFGYTLLFTSSVYSAQAKTVKTNILDPNIFSSTLPASDYAVTPSTVISSKTPTRKSSATASITNTKKFASKTKKTPLPSNSSTYPQDHFQNQGAAKTDLPSDSLPATTVPTDTLPVEIVTPASPNSVIPESSPYRYEDFVPKNGTAPKVEMPSNTTQDVTQSPNRSTIASPQVTGQSARTRPNFTPNPKQQASLDRLKQYYQPKPAAMLENTASPSALNSQPMCVGTWVYPTNKYQQKNNLANTNLTQNNVTQNTTKNITPNSSYPTYAEADYGYYDNDNYAELTGNVLVNQGSQQISADKVVVNVKDGIAAAQGNVSLVDASNYDATANTTGFEAPLSDLAKRKPKKLGVKGGLITMADEIAYQTDNSKATAKDVAFASVPLQAHGYAKQLNQVDESHFEIQDVMLTTCPPDHPAWQINAKNIDINSDTGRGQAYNATLKVKNTPVLYLPYFNFPIDSRRSSGFLLPRAGFSSDGGVNLQTPYYFNLAPNYDATLTPSIFSNRNPMLTGEFRYLTPAYGHGRLSASYLPNDRQYNDQDRDSVFFEHKWQSPRYPTLSAEAVYQHVSDSAYFSDFDTLGISGNPLNLPRRLQASYFDDNFTALAKVESFQTLDDDLSDNKDVLDKDKPYRRLPQLSLSYKLPWVKNFDVTGISDFAYFKRPIHDGSAPEQSGGRLYNKIVASKPFERPWGYITPSVALQHLYTQYDEETVLAKGISDKNKSQSVFVPQVGLDAGLNFFKAGSPFGKYDSSLGGYQVLSPRIKYLYSPYKDQSDVPNFNTRVASLNYPQLFEDSWFLGYDRLPDNNHVTPALNYRYIDGNGLTRLDASIGQQFYLSDIKVRLDSDKPLTLNTSGTVVQLSGQPKPNFWTDFDGAITDSGDLGYYNLQMRYQPNTRSLYNVGFIQRNPYELWGQKKLSAITGSAIFPIRDNWRFLGAAQYDRNASRFSDVLVGLDYESCCYGFAVYGRRYYNDLNNKTKPTQAIMAELSLSGIANKREGRLATLINDRVLGYNQLNRF